MNDANKDLPAEAIAALERGSRLDPANSSGHAGYLMEFLAEHYLRADRHEEALSCFLKAAELEPNWAEP